MVAHRGAGSHEGFSIGEAAAMVGVSTHVIRSWERRLSLGLNHRTETNQRRYRMEDVQRFVAIKRLHETSGMPLVEAAAKALNGAGPSRVWDDAVPSEAVALEHLWASLIETLPELLLVVDEAGRIVAANSTARNSLNVKTGASLTTLAPPGWQITYRALRRGQLNHGGSLALAMRGKSGIVFADVQFVPLGRTPDGAAVIVGTLQPGPTPPVAPGGPLH